MPPTTSRSYHQPIDLLKHHFYLLITSARACTVKNMHQNSCRLRGSVIRLHLVAGFWPSIHHAVVRPSRATHSLFPTSYSLRVCSFSLYFFRFLKDDLLFPSFFLSRAPLTFVRPLCFNELRLELLRDCTLTEVNSKMDLNTLISNLCLITSCEKTRCATFSMHRVSRRNSTSRRRDRFRWKNRETGCSCSVQLLVHDRSRWNGAR